MRPTPATVALRALAAACAVAAALDPTVDAAPARTRVVVVDASRSLARGRAATSALARAAWADLAPRDRVAVVVVGADVAAAAPVPAAGAPAALEATLARPLDPRGTRLDLGLRAALDVGGPGAEVVLVSDGRDTGSAALEAAADLAAAGARLVACAPDAPPPLGVRVARLEAPPRAPAGARLAVEVEVEAAAGDARRVAVHLGLAAEGAPAGAAPPTSWTVAGEVAPGAPLRAAFVTPPLPGPGAVRLRARAVAAGPDDAPEDDEREALVVVGGARRAWLVAGSGGDGGLGAALAGAGLAVEAVPGADLAAALAGPVRPDLVVLADAPWSDALARAAPGLRRALEAGAGLLAVGCDAAFGPGGWAGTALDDLLPVRCGPGRERERPLAVVVALDGSGSMGQALPEGGTRWRQAVPAALLAAGEGGALEEGDGLAVVTFAARPATARPLAPLAPGELATLRAALLARAPGGATDVGAAVVAALEVLAGAAPAGGEPPERVVVLVTDAADPRAAAAAPAAAGVVARLRAAGGPAPALLVVLVGAAPADAAALRPLLDAVGPDARVALAADADAAVRDLVRGELLARRAALRRGDFAAALTPAGAARRLPLPARVPAFAPTRPRDDAEVLAAARDEATRDPPLAALGRVGAGRVAALPLAPALAAGLAGALAAELAPAPDEAAAVDARREGDHLVVEVTGRDLPPALAVEARDADGRAARAPLVAATPGLARGVVRAPSARALDVLVSAAGAPVARGVVPDAAVDEARGGPPDAAALARLCAATGGRVVAALPAPPSVWAAPAGGGALRLAPGLALAALVALVLDAARAALAVRRAAGRPA